MESPRQPTSPVDDISTPSTGSAFCRRANENWLAFTPMRSMSNSELVKEFTAFADKNEAILKKLADSINSGTIDKAALLDLGKNALAEIKKANGELNGKYADLMKPVANIMQMQEDRAQAMIDGVNGNLARFAEGGNMKTKVLELLAQFKKENNL